MSPSFSKLTCAILSTCVLSPALAKDNLAEQSLERITVTGSRIIESFDEVPASITVIDQQTIEENLNTSSELQSLLSFVVPGMAPATGSTSNFGQTLRGRNMLIMIDGVPQDTPLRNGALGIRTLDPAAIERIEVLNGATSIWGNGAAGGVINYITKKPTAEPVQFSLTQALHSSLVETEDSLGYRTVLSAHGSRDALGFVLKLSQENYGVQRDADGDILGLQYGLSDSTQRDIFAKLTYAIDAEKSVQLTYNFYDSDQNADYKDVSGIIDLGEKTYAVPLTEGESNRGAPQGPEGNSNLMLKYEDRDLFANTAWTLDAYAQTIDNVFFWSPTLGNPEAGYEGGQSAILSEKLGVRSVLTSQLEVMNVPSTLIYGIDLLEDVTSQPLLDGRIWVPEMDMQSTALFLQTKWDLGYDWTLKAGVRHEDIAVAVDDYETLKVCRTAQTCSTPMMVDGGEMNYAATTFNIGLRYRSDSGLSPYISYSEGFEVPDLGLLMRTATVTDVSLIASEASIIKNYELGLSGEWQRLYYTLAAFRSTSELGTRSEYDPTSGIYRPVRAPQEIWGYEATVDYRLNDFWQLIAAYGYTEGKDTENDEYLGARQISAPKLSTSVRYHLPQGLKLSVNWLHVFDRDRFEPNLEGFYSGDQGPIENYDVVNLSARYELANWELFLGIENVLNSDYFPARAQAFRYGTGYSVKGKGATANLGFTYHF
ncbi:TonB-dependent receptor [Pseudidiomarina insulisalsae]|uniref:Ligand-gated channel protein n=1 Tax=Pseudidiomarina insulisalsae TaxID=575789 RepID=A0A432YCS6_9GAMM|nr:TonB-dependent receptor [Pseudidiomarina insulisalsae]RUO58727.1 ligand-gated channel protein [Pseudidiomarina insulisalsae]